MAKGIKTGGRVKGTPNKATAQFREAIKGLIDGNHENVSRWLYEVAEGCPEKNIQPNPAKAFELYLNMMEYVVPKLSRVEQVDSEGNTVVPQKIVLTPLENKKIDN
jgi:hypothetical protein